MSETESDTWLSTCCFPIQPYIFLSSLSSKFERVHICFTEERFPDSDRTMCRFGRVVTGATIEDDGTEGGISQFPTCKRVKTRENPEALACQVPAS